MRGLGDGFGRAWTAGGAQAALFVATAVGAAAQTLPVKDQPAAASVVCDRPVELPVCTNAGNSDEVRRLIASATQALILGDLTVAEEFLDRALEANPCAAEAVYLQGRLVVQTDGIIPATESFCRYLALDPQGPSAAEARRRLAQAVQEGAGADLMASFSAGVSRLRDGDLAGAEEHFTSVLQRHPVPEAYYDRALTRVEMNRPVGARNDLQRYLELDTQASDRSTVSDAIRTLDANRSSHNATTAFALGAVLPGGGQYYTDRVAYGVAVTGLVTTALAAGLLYRVTTVECRVQAVDGECPPDAVASRTTERPLLTRAIAVGAGLTLLSAIEATMRASGGAEGLTVVASRAGELQVAVGASPSLSGDAVAIRLFRLIR